MLLKLFLRKAGVGDGSQLVPTTQLIISNYFNMIASHDRE